MLGFDLDIWDYLTFLVLTVAGLGVLIALVWLAGLPGQIAIARNHPEAEAVRLMGYAGFFTVVVWLKAFLWAFKPTDIVDIRRYPEAEAIAIEKEIALLKGEPAPRPPGTRTGRVAQPPTEGGKQS